MPFLEDFIGNKIPIEKVFQKIISIVPSQTELLYDLGLEEQIVGITKFCIHPLHFKATKKIIGGTKKVHFDKIISLLPDIIIANKEENTQEMIIELQKICPVFVTDVITLDDNLKMIETFGKLFNKRVEAQKIIHKLQFATLDFLEFIKIKKTRKVAYFIWANPYMVAGNNTFINSMLALNKFENIYANQTYYKERYPEIIIQKMQIQGDPDLILLSSEPFPFKDEQAFELGRYTHHATTLFVNGEMFSWYGSRILKSFAYFKKIHERIASIE